MRKNKLGAKRIKERLEQMEENRLDTISCFILIISLVIIQTVLMIGFYQHLDIGVKESETIGRGTIVEEEIIDDTVKDSEVEEKIIDDTVEDSEVKVKTIDKGMILLALSDSNQANNILDDIDNKYKSILEPSKEIISSCKWKLDGVSCVPEIIRVYFDDNGEQAIVLSAKEREVIAGVLTAETGGYWYDNLGTFVDKILVAQCIREEVEKTGKLPSELANGTRYSRPKYVGISEQAYLAVDLVLAGYGVVASGIDYFYNPRYTISRFHEKQIFICQTSLHRYFRGN